MDVAGAVTTIAPAAVAATVRDVRPVNPVASIVYPPPVVLMLTSSMFLTVTPPGRAVAGSCQHIQAIAEASATVKVIEGARRINQSTVKCVITSSASKCSAGILTSSERTCAAKSKIDCFQRVATSFGLSPCPHPPTTQLGKVCVAAGCKIEVLCLSRCLWTQPTPTQPTNFAAVRIGLGWFLGGWQNTIVSSFLKLRWNFGGPFSARKSRTSNLWLSKRRSTF